MTHAEHLPFQSRRSPVLSSRGLVATSQPLAASAGAEILRAGGNAADAAIATAAALAVTEPTGTGLGGDCFALWHDAASGRVEALNGSGRAPAGATIAGVRAAGIDGPAIPMTSAHAVTVPGTVDGWASTLARWGSMPLGEVLAPAIRLAEGGFPVSPLIAAYWGEEVAEKLAAQPNGRDLTVDGRAPRPGETWRNAALGAVLREIAEGGPDAFYRGRAGAAIVEVLASLGSPMTADDLAAHRTSAVEPISTRYRDLTVWECPPNGQGLATLVALGVLDGFDLGAWPVLAPERLHLMIEAMRIGFADARAYVADPDAVAVPTAALLSPEYAARRRAGVDPTRAITTHAPGLAATPGGDTVYMAVVDGAGNACSFINSNYQGMGTGIVPAGCGFPLHNRGSNFSLDPEHPNALAGGKRPYHTIIPALASRDDGSLFACFAVKGGFAQPQGQIQVLSNLVDHGMEPQAALDVPRFCLRPASPDGRVALELGIPVESMHALARMGHDVIPSTDRFWFGTGQAIWRDPRTGAHWGGTDPRADGSVVAVV